VDGQTDLLEGRTLLMELVGELNRVFYSIYVAVTDFPLKYSFILDSGSSIHIPRTPSRFSNFRKAPLGHYAVCGSGVVTIQGYGDADIQLTGRKRILRLHDVAYCPYFPTNLVSLQLLEIRGIDWKHRDGELTFRGDS
jgi:Pol polyprotein